MKCFWHNWKASSLTVVQLCAMLIEIRYRHLPIFKGSVLDQLLQGKGLWEGVEQGCLRESLILEIFKDNFEKRKYKQKHGGNESN